jgi:hypothetical protein
MGVTRRHHVDPELIAPAECSNERLRVEGGIGQRKLADMVGEMRATRYSPVVLTTFSRTTRRATRRRYLFREELLIGVPGC